MAVEEGSTAHPLSPPAGEAVTFSVSGIQGIGTVLSLGPEAEGGESSVVVATAPSVARQVVSEGRGWLVWPRPEMARVWRRAWVIEAVTYNTVHGRLVGPVISGLARAPRLTLTLPVELWQAGRQWFGTTLDLSLSGVRALFLEAPSANASAHWRLSLPPPHRPLVLAGRVLRVEPRANGVEVAGRWERSSLADEQAFEALKAFYLEAISHPSR